MLIESAAKKKAYYYLWQIDVIGQLSTELLALKSVFGDVYDLHVVTSNPHKNSRVNHSVFEMLTRDISVSYTDDIDLLRSVHLCRGDEKVIGIHEFEDHVHIALPPEKLVEECIKRFGRSGWNYICKLDQADVRKGLALKNALGMPEDARIVTLHVRESGYHSQMEQYYNVRNADIRNYQVAVEYLLDRGYYVVRLGDKTMTPLPVKHERVIDAPFHQYYADFFEPYFISQSRFYVGMPSGPETLAYVFDVPLLRTNGLFQWGGNGYYKGLAVYKHYWSKQLGRNLTYQEIMTSPILNYNNPEQFTLSGIEIRENSSAELLQAVIEIEGRVSGAYIPDASLDREIEKQHSVAMLYNNANKPACGTGWNMQEISYMQISHEYLKLNPDFIGHRFVDSVTDPTHRMIHA